MKNVYSLELLDKDITHKELDTLAVKFGGEWCISEWDMAPGEAGGLFALELHEPNIYFCPQSQEIVIHVGSGNREQNAKRAYELLMEARNLWGGQIDLDGDTIVEKKTVLTPEHLSELKSGKNLGLKSAFPRHPAKIVDSEAFNEALERMGSDFCTQYPTREAILAEFSLESVLGACLDIN